MISLFALLVALFSSVPVASFVLQTTSISRKSCILHTVSESKDASSEYSIVEAKPKKEYAALSPGCAVQIQVGDVSLARKAWKKRRRSGSPLLVPCSILNVDRRKMVRNNIFYLVQKFGMPLTKMEIEQVGFVSDDICLSTADIRKYYLQHLRTPLSKHAKALGHDTARSLVQDLFNAKKQENLGVRLWMPPREDEEFADDVDDNCPMWLIAPLSKQRARRMASQAGVLEFESNDNGTNGSDEHENDDDNTDKNSRMQHTGFLRINSQHTKGGQNRLHPLVPLSAALRVSQVEQALLQSGSTHEAFVFSLDDTGDGGSPLMIVSLHRTRGQVRDRLKLKMAGKRHFGKDRRLQVVGEMERNFDDLKVGDGPIKAKVMRMSTGSGAAFVDCGVGRSTKDGNTRVLGMLRFDDLVQFAFKDELDAVHDEGQLIENNMSDDGDEEGDDVTSAEDLFFFADDEDEEDAEFSEQDGDVDITDLLTMEDDIVSYVDPDTGKKVIVSETDVGTPLDDDENDTDNMFTGLSSQERLELLAKIVKDGTVTHSHDDEIGEEEMDITHLVSIEDGVMTYKDPGTGESVVLSDSSMDDDEEECEEDDDDDEDDPFIKMSPEERLELISNIMNDREAAADSDDPTADVDDEDKENEKDKDSFQAAFVQVGDEVEVYIKSVFKQSGRFMVTLDPSVQGRKPKDLKRESETDKKLARLAEKMGGLERILKLEGTECDGIVQAISNTGDWCYVKPSIEHLPVGVAKLSSEDTVIQKGDTVRVRMDGIDESRGQLAMTVM